MAHRAARSACRGRNARCELFQGFMVGGLQKRDVRAGIDASAKACVVNGDFDAVHAGSLPESPTGLMVPYACRARTVLPGNAIFSQ